MINSYDNCVDGEIPMTNIVAIGETKTTDYPEGCLVLVGGLTIDTNEPYVLFIKGGILDNGIGRSKTVDQRISLREPKYIQYDQLFTEYERMLFNNIMHENWEDVKTIQNDLQPSCTIDNDCPDYLSLSIM